MRSRDRARLVSATGFARASVVLALASAVACGPQTGETAAPSTGSEVTGGETTSGVSTGAATDTDLSSTGATSSGAAEYADVVEVTISGEPGDYTFAVEVSSPDTGCEQYADWWEVVTPDGLLLYRRILAHSHVDEQPFTRTGGPVPIDAADVVVVRAHLNPHGYGGQVLRGSVADGFAPAPELEEGFAESLESSEPLPGACQF